MTESDMESHETLFAAWRHGEGDKLQELVRRFEEPLFRFLLRRGAEGWGEGCGEVRHRPGTVLGVVFGAGGGGGAGVDGGASLRLGGLPGERPEGRRAEEAAPGGGAGAPGAVVSDGPVDFRAP